MAPPRGFLVLSDTVHFLVLGKSPTGMEAHLSSSSVRALSSLLPTKKIIKCFPLYILYLLLIQHPYTLYHTYAACICSRELSN